MESRFHSKVYELALPYSISTQKTNFLEDLALRAAKVSVIPNESHWDVIENSILQFTYLGLPNNEAKQFLEFLIKDCHDQSATHYNKEDWEYFEMSIEVALNQLMPKIENEVHKLANDPNSTVLDEYKYQSDDDNILCLYKYILAIQQACATLNTTLPNEFLHNELNQFLSAMEAFEEDRTDFNEIKASQVLNSAAAINNVYNSQCSTKPFGKLFGNESAFKLYKNLGEYVETTVYPDFLKANVSFSMFKVAQKSVPPLQHTEENKPATPKNNP